MKIMMEKAFIYINPVVGADRMQMLNIFWNQLPIFISTDPRKKIDGRKATDGIIRPRPSKPPEDGFPEALHFYLNHKCPTYTIETPSEFDLHLRIEAQKAMIQKALSLILDFN